MLFDFEERYMLWNIQKSDIQQIQSMSVQKHNKKAGKKPEQKQIKNKTKTKQKQKQKQNKVKTKWKITCELIEF